MVLLGIHSFIFYYITNFSPLKQFQSIKLASLNRIRILKLSFTSAGAVVPYGDAVQNGNNDGPSTVVELTDADLNELLQIVFAETGNSNLISAELLQALGLYTDTVVSLLEALGYIIF